MVKKRSAAGHQIAELLATARSTLGMSVAVFSKFDGATQHLQVVDSAVPLLFHDGVSQRQETSLCQAVLDGTLPPVIPDVRAFPLATPLPAARIMGVRSYVMAPVMLSHGSLYGTLAAFGFTPTPTSVNGIARSWACSPPRRRSSWSPRSASYASAPRSKGA